MLAPDGEFLCYNSEDRIQWYLDRDLAELVQEANPRTIRLNFEPKGRSGSDDPFYSTRRENKCVVCGTDKDLTIHHVIPHCFRKFLPEKYKEHSSHDCLALCRSCHDDYEIEAAELKKSLARQYNCIDYAFAWDDEDDFRSYADAVKSAIALIEHGDKIPAERKKQLTKMVAPFLGNDFTYRDLEKFTHVNSMKNSKGKRMNFAEKVVAQLKDVDEFCIMWRNHFIEKSNPKHMPENWDPNRRIDDMEDGTKKGFSIKKWISRMFKKLFRKKQ